MTKPRLLDLFCGAGGSAMGYHRAGFDVVGVDIKPQPRYPFLFVQSDALEFLARNAGHFDAIHASPPCHDHLRALGGQAKDGTGWLLDATRERLLAQERPWIIENVPGAPMRADYRLCGCHFGLQRLKRERWFETNWHGVHVPPNCYHPEPTISVTGNGTPTGTWKVYGSIKVADFRALMGIDWMSRAELSQAIPPAYTEYLGHQLMTTVQQRIAP